MKNAQNKYGLGGPVIDILQSDAGSNVKKALMMKADKIDIEKIYEMKSNKVDTDNMLDCQELMCKYFKQILVLFIELVNNQMLRKSESKNSFEKR